jgi:toxin YoeB
VRPIFSSDAWAQYQFWRASDQATFAKLNGLIADAMRDPFRGIGKPEPLKGDLSGWWSRRLTGEHRLVYRITGAPPDQSIEIAQCQFHC